MEDQENESKPTPLVNLELSKSGLTVFVDASFARNLEHKLAAANVTIEGMTETMLNMLGVLNSEREKLAAANERIAQLESERENWRMSSVCREAVDRAQKAEARIAELDSSIAEILKYSGLAGETVRGSHESLYLVLAANLGTIDRIAKRTQHGLR